MQLSRYMNLVEMNYSSSGGLACVADCQNAEGAFFLGVPGTTTARTWEMLLSHGNTTAGLVACSSNWGLGSTAAARQMKAIDVHKPRRRYVAATMSATADGEVRIFAFTYGLRKPAGAWTPTVVGTCGLGYSVANGAVKRVVSPSSTAP